MTLTIDIMGWYGLSNQVHRKLLPKRRQRHTLCIISHSFSKEDAFQGLYITSKVECFSHKGEQACS